MNFNLYQSNNNLKKLEKKLLKYHKLSSYVGKKVCKSSFPKNFFRKTVLVEDLGYSIKKDLESTQNIDFSKTRKIEFYKKIQKVSIFSLPSFFFLASFNSHINKFFSILNIVPLISISLAMTSIVFSFFKIRSLEKKEQILNSTSKDIMNYY
ncbi:MAG: hypothetical protein ACK4J0_01590 [Candidatus Anstonellaceae archaeon]